MRFQGKLTEVNDDLSPWSYDSSQSQWASKDARYATNHLIGES